VDVERDHLHRETLREFGKTKERISEHRVYDPQSRLTGILLNKGNRRLAERRYEYDAASNLIHIQNSFGDSIHYTYDPPRAVAVSIAAWVGRNLCLRPCGEFTIPRFGLIVN
jgi:uncharacterized protein RhaS with RHS repeats